MELYPEGPVTEQEEKGEAVDQISAKVQILKYG